MKYTVDSYLTGEQTGEENEQMFYVRNNRTNRCGKKLHVSSDSAQMEANRKTRIADRRSRMKTPRAGAYGDSCDKIVG